MQIGRKSGGSTSRADARFSRQRRPGGQFRFPLTLDTLNKDKGGKWRSGVAAMREDQPGFRTVPKRSKLVRASVLDVELVDFSYHAQMRMKDRGVTEEDVLSALRNPNETGLKAETGEEHVRWKKDRHTWIDVVYAKNTNPDRIGIITVWKSKRTLIRPKRRQR